MKKLLLLQIFLFVFLSVSFVSCSDDKEDEHPAWLLTVVEDFKTEQDSPVGVYYCLYNDLYYYKLYANKTNTIIFYDRLNGSKIVEGDLYELLKDEAVEITALRIY